MSNNAYLTVRRYEGVPDSKQAASRVQEFIPLISKIPGFISYYLVGEGDGVTVSVSVFATREAEEESNRLAADFIKQHLAPLLPNPPQITAGQVVARATPSGSSNDSAIGAAARGGDSENGCACLAQQMSKSSRATARRKRADSTNAELTPRKLQVLRETFSLLEPHAGNAGLAFYRNLFNSAPSLRPLFQSSIELQARKLMEALSYTIATLEQPEALLPVLEAMGRRHVSYGVVDEHYDIVIQAMLQTFAQMLEAKFSSEARDAWEEALFFVARVMKRGAADAAVPKQVHR